METLAKSNTDITANEWGTKRREYNGVRFKSDSRGHYESYFVRANHPSKAQGFWIRYTIFSPKTKPERGIGELWFIFFDGERRQVTAAKEELGLEHCEFSATKLYAKMGDSIFEGGDQGGSLSGSATTKDTSVSWQLDYVGNHEPLLDFPSALYSTPLPKAKALVGNPNVIFNGLLKINGEQINIDGWQGSENHNWGSKHTDEYAWGQVAGFDNNPDAFLECATARLKLGPFWTPQMTLVTLRLGDEEFALNSILESVKANAIYSYFNWRFETSKPGIKIRGWIRADSDLFVGLNYYNPPGGSHTCLNCKIAESEVVLERDGHEPILLYTKNRAAFEILTDDVSHGVRVVS